MYTLSYPPPNDSSSIHNILHKDRGWINNHRIVFGNDGHTTSQIDCQTHCLAVFGRNRVCIVFVVNVCVHSVWALVLYLDGPGVVGRVRVQVVISAVDEDATFGSAGDCEDEKESGEFV